MDVQTLLNAPQAYSIPGTIQNHDREGFTQPDPSVVLPPLMSSESVPPPPPPPPPPALPNGGAEDELGRMSSTSSEVPPADVDDDQHPPTPQPPPPPPPEQTSNMDQSTPQVPPVDPPPARVETPPPPPPPAAEPPVVNADPSMSEEQQATLAYYTSMLPMPEDTSDPDEKELRHIEATSEHTAHAEAYWERKTFKDLGDPEYVASDKGTFDWIILKVHGTKENPNMDIIMRSPTFVVGGYTWRLKFFPKGNQSSYFGIYLECVDFLEADTKEATESIQPVLQIPGQETLQRPVHVPVQFMIVMYNPSEPRAHYHKSASHAFSKKSPDRGFQRFGGTQFYNLGIRSRYHRKALVLNDTVGFCIYLRTIKDPTASLFAETDDGKWNSFAMTGLHGVSSPGSGTGSNLVSAVVMWSMLALFRSAICSVKIPDPDEDAKAKPMPLVHAFQQLFYLIRNPARNAQYSVALDEIKNALLWHGVSIPDSSDVVATWEVLKDVLENEMADTPQAGAVNDLFAHGGFRALLNLQGPQPIGTVQQGITAPGSHGFPRKDHKWPKILQVELGRQVFDKSAREWKKIEEKITVNQMLSLKGSPTKAGKDGPTVPYVLYGFVSHRGGLRYGSFTPIVRPNGRDWFKFTNSREHSLVLRLTHKQAIHEADSSAYLAIYVRPDIAGETMLSRTKDYKGSPESLWPVPRIVVDDAMSLQGHNDDKVTVMEDEPTPPKPDESIEIEICYSQSLLKYHGPGMINLYDRNAEQVRSNISTRRFLSSSTIAGVKRILSEEDRHEESGSYRLLAMDLRAGSVFRPKLWEIEKEDTYTVHGFATDYPERRMWLHVPSASDFKPPPPPATANTEDEPNQAKKVRSDENTTDQATAAQPPPPPEIPQPQPRPVYFIVKMFDAKKQEMYGIGSYIASATEQVGSSVRMRAFPNLAEEQKLEFYEETEPSGAVPIHAKHTFSSLGLSDGCIIIAQPELSREEEDQVLLGGGLVQPTTFLHHLYQKANQSSGPELSNAEVPQQELPGATYQRNYFGGEYHIGHQSKGCLHGEGVHYYFNGNVYNGTYKMGVRNGKGTMTFQSGDVYTGDWDDDKMHGQGKYVHRLSGNTYEGGFKDGKKHGQGTTQWMRVEQDVRHCLICLEREQDCAFYDCGHVCACMECASTVSKCPICRKDNVRAMKLFF